MASHPNLKWAAIAVLTIVLLLTISATAQVCVGLPATPTSTVTATQDRDQMMCQLGLTFPSLPVRSGTAWPWNDPTAPTNAWPKAIASPEGNWTDAQGHTVIRTSWGNWHTYDSETQFEPPAELHYPDVAATYKGGAMTGVGDFGPLSNPRYTDIDLLEMKDGSPVNAPEDWWTKRRPEIFKFVQKELYGNTLSDFRPAITWTIANGTSGNQTGTDGKSYAYRQKTFTGVVSNASYPALRNVPRIVMNCRFPAATGRKYPAIVVFGGNTLFNNTAPYSYGICGYTNASVAPDSGGAALSSYVIGLKNQGNWRSPEDPGALVSWAWGISRFIDYLESSNDADIDADKIGVEGHSRFGKASLVAAAYDDRIVAAFPSCGGSLGTSWARRAYGETLDYVSSSTSEYHWIAGNAMSYAGPVNAYGPRENQFPRKVQDLDVDVHSMMALIAPRAVLTNGGTDNSAGNGDAWQDPRGMYLAGAVSGPVWEFLGWPGQVIPAGTPFTTSTGYAYPATCANNTTAGRSVCDPSAESVGGTPPFDVPFIEGTVGWRRHKEGHTDSPEWPTFALFAARYFNDGRPVVAPQSFSLGAGSVNYVGTALGSDPDGDFLSHWQIKGGSGVGVFKINDATGDITVPDPSKVDTTRTTPYTLTVFVGDSKTANGATILPSHDATITINPAPLVAGPVQLITTASLAKLGDGSYRATVKISNRGAGTAQNVWLTSATIGSGVGSVVPQSLVNIPQNGYAITTVDFPASVGSSGAPVIEKFAGTYNGGSFVGSLRAVLP
jgi:hypothetical protein